MFRGGYESLARQFCVATFSLHALMPDWGHDNCVRRCFHRTRHNLACVDFSFKILAVHVFGPEVRWRIGLLACSRLLSSNCWRTSDFGDDSCSGNNGNIVMDDGPGISPEYRTERIETERLAKTRKILGKAGFACLQALFHQNNSLIHHSQNIATRGNTLL